MILKRFCWVVLTAWSTAPGFAAEPAWVERYNGPGNDGDSGYAVVVAHGSVFVAGTAYEPEPPNVRVPRAYLARHDAATGARLWTLLYGSVEGSSANYGCFDLLLAPDGDLLLGCSKSFAELAVIRVSPAGEVRWVRTRPSCGCLPNFADITLDAAGNVYLAGKGPGSVAAVAAFDTLGGLVGSWTYGGPLGGSVVSEVAVDAGGNVYLAGSTGVAERSAEASLVKLAPGGGVVWERFYGGEGANTLDNFTSLLVSADQVVAAGGLNGNTAAGSDAVVVAHDLAGTVVWRYDHLGLPGRSDDFSRMVPAPGGGLFAAGGLERTALNDWDPLLVRLDASGGLMWERTLAGPSATPDRFRALAAAPEGGVVALGTEETGGLNSAYLLARFGATGGLLDRAGYPGPLGSSRAWGVAVDAAGNTFVTGSSYSGVVNGADVATLRYSRPDLIFQDNFESGGLVAWAVPAPPP